MRRGGLPLHMQSAHPHPHPKSTVDLRLHAKGLPSQSASAVNTVFGPENITAKAWRVQTSASHVDANSKHANRGLQCPALNLVACLQINTSGRQAMRHSIPAIPTVTWFAFKALHTIRDARIPCTHPLPAAAVRADTTTAGTSRGEGGVLPNTTLPQKTTSKCHAGAPPVTPATPPVR